MNKKFLNLINDNVNSRSNITFNGSKRAEVSNYNASTIVNRVVSLILIYLAFEAGGQCLRQRKPQLQAATLVYFDVLYECYIFSMFAMT